MSVLIGANWKMNPRTLAEAKELARAISVPGDGIEVVFFPPTIFLQPLAEAFPHLMWGAQNVFWESEGAYTGELSLGMARDAGAHYVLVGHSERRRLFGETDEMVAQKAAAALAKGFRVILAVGEMEKGAAASAVVASLKASTVGIAGQDFERLTVAYEPVWAISTTPGAERATGEYVQSVVAGLKKELPVRYIYGGSVSGTDVRDFLAQPDINGALVGGASLVPDKFNVIMKSAAEHGEEG